MKHSDALSFVHCVSMPSLHLSLSPSRCLSTFAESLLHRKSSAVTMETMENKKTCCFLHLLPPNSDRCDDAVPAAMFQLLRKYPTDTRSHTHTHTQHRVPLSLPYIQ